MRPELASAIRREVGRDDRLQRAASEHADYGWIIDKDFTESGWADAGANGPGRGAGYASVNIVGPRDISPATESTLRSGGGQAFQLYDSDGYLYYTGRWIEGQYPDEQNPLDDFGGPNAGCTRMTVGNSKPYIGNRASRRKIANVDTSALLWFTDPGHGWLRVPLDSCKGLGISSYSYMDTSKGFAYLEEDSDAGKWLKAHGVSEMYANTISWRAAQGESFVRRLPSFDEGAISTTARRKIAGESVEVASLPNCDLCGKQAQYDAKTQMGPWAYLCEGCFAKVGPGRLGTGYGQRLVVRANRRKAHRRTAWTPDGSDITPMADTLMGIDNEVRDETGTQSYSDSNDPARVRDMKMMAERIAPLLDSITQADLDVLEDYNYHTMYAAVEYARTGQLPKYMAARRKAHRRTTAKRRVSSERGDGKFPDGTYHRYSDGTPKMYDEAGWIEAVRDAILEYEVQGGDVPGDFTEEKIAELAVAAEDYAGGSPSVDSVMDYFEAEGLFDYWTERMAVRRTANGNPLTSWVVEQLLDLPPRKPCEICRTPVDADVWAEESGMCLDCSNDYYDEALMDSDPEAWNRRFRASRRPARNARRGAAKMNTRRTASRRRKVAYRTVHDGDNVRIEQTDQNAMWIISYWDGDTWVSTVPTMADTLAEVIYSLVSSLDGEFADPILAGTAPRETINELWDLYEKYEAALAESGYYEASRRTTRNARKEATVNNRRTPARRPVPGRVAGRTPARRTPVARTAARRPVAGRSVAPRRVAGRVVPPTRRTAGRGPVRRPVAGRARTAGFARGAVVTLKREATRTRTPLTLRVVATRNGKFVGERLAGRRPTGEMWEFTSREVLRTAAQAPARRPAPAMARRRRIADQSTSTDIPGGVGAAPAGAVGEAPEAPDADLFYPGADVDGTDPDWYDDPRDLPMDSGVVTETSPTAEEYSGDADVLEAPVAGTDADITVDGEVVGLTDQDTETSTDIPDDATEVTASRRTEARFFAAQRLAQLRVESGVVQGDPVVIGHKLVASKMSLNEMQKEIQTLDRVITVRGSVDEGPVKVAQERKGGLVPRSSNRTVPSMVAAPSAPVADGGDDFALFE